MNAHSTSLRMAIFGALLSFGSLAAAAVSPQDAERLGKELTPLGGERSANADGSIPAWDGGYTKPVAGYVEGGRRPDPFANEKPLLSINAKNMAQYADKLSEGVKAMMQKYPDSFRIDVYPTHRTAAAPQWVYDNTRKNATTAKLDGGKLQGAYGGIPFPIPQSAEEVMWNHLLRWRGSSWHVDVRGVQTTANGSHVPASWRPARSRCPITSKTGPQSSCRAATVITTG